MTQRTRKLIGTITMAVYVIVYALFAMLVGATFFAQSATWAQTLYYGVAGLIWIIPAGLLIRWMARPDPS